jgi:hypothetical protein
MHPFALDVGIPLSRSALRVAISDLLISDDLAPELEAGDSYDVALVDAVKHIFNCAMASRRTVASPRRPCARSTCRSPRGSSSSKLRSNACSAWISSYRPRARGRPPIGTRGWMALWRHVEAWWPAARNWDGSLSPPAPSAPGRATLAVRPPAFCWAYVELDSSAAPNPAMMMAFTASPWPSTKSARA